MHAAAGLGYDSVVQYLADHGAQVNVKNKRGLTPLAALSVGGRGRGRGPAAAANLDAGADLTGVDNAEPAHANTAALLRKLGAVP
jgi:ankyrin repeat protein